MRDAYKILARNRRHRRENSPGPGYGSVSCDRGNELSGSIRGKFLDRLTNNNQLLKKDPSPCNWS
jgi:hypothetical protein